MLNQIMQFVEKHRKESYTISVDHPNSNYTFPSSIAASDMRPDLVVWSKSLKVEASLISKASLNYFKFLIS